MDYLRRWVPDQRPPVTRAVAGTAVAVLLSVLLGLALQPQLQSAPFITVFPAVAGAALLFGPAAGIGVAVVGGLVAAVLWIPPYAVASFGTSTWVTLLIFWLMSAVIVGIAFLVRLTLDELRSVEREATLRAGEMRHRLQNLIAFIIAISRGTEKGAASASEFRSKLEGRLEALSSANALLVNPEVATSLHSLLRRLLASVGEDRFELSGPRCVVRSSSSLVLGIHELSTNSLKYGALSLPGGRVRLSWTARDGQIEVEWSEEGGPPVSPPARTGFGSRVLSSLGADIIYEPAGLVCRFAVVGTADNAAVKEPVGLEEDVPELLFTSVRQRLELHPTVERLPSGRFVVRLDGHYLPGEYASAEAASFAVCLPDRVLRQLSGADLATEGPKRALGLNELEDAFRKWRHLHP